MAAVASVTTATAPPPPVGGGAPNPALQNAPGPVVSAPVAPPVQPPVAPPEASGPSVLQIQSVLTSVELALDNGPEEHPNAPDVVVLEAEANALRSALTQVSLGEVDSAAGYFSGLLLNASA